MKVKDNATINVNEVSTHRNRRTGEIEQTKGKSVRASELNINNKLTNDIESRIEKRKQQAQKQAMKVMGDAFAGEQKLDEAAADYRTKADEATERNGELNSQMKAISERKKELSEGNQPVDEQELKEIDATIQNYQSQIDKNNSEIEGNMGAVREMSIERLKAHPIVDAQKQVDTINKAASDEIVGMLMNDAKDHVDDNLQKAQEEAQKKEDKEQETGSSDNKADAADKTSADAIQTVSNSIADAQKEVKNIINKMKILNSDINGAAVDKTL